MKILFTALISIAAIISSYSQNSISGTIMDDITKEPLSFSSIYIDGKIVTIADKYGNFEIKNPQSAKNIKISYIGYHEKLLKTNEHQKHYNLFLSKKEYMLNNIILMDRKVNPAVDIIKKAIANKNKNNPDNVFDSYTYKVYNKFLITANPDNIKGNIDTIWTKKGDNHIFKEVDSSSYISKKIFTKSHLYISEKISKYKYKKGLNKQEEVIAFRMAGLEKPIYEALALELQSNYIYDDYYIIAGSKFLNPIASNRAFYEYNYNILDTIHGSLGNVFLIHFKSKKNTEMGLEGVLYINEHKFAIQKSIVEVNTILKIKKIIELKYIKSNDIWFANSSELLVKKGDSKDDVSMFGGTISFNINNPNKSDSSSVNDDDFYLGNYLYLNSKNTIFDVSINKKSKINDTSISIIVHDDADKKDNLFWQKYRTDTITTRGINTYTLIDSISKDIDINKKIELIKYIPLGFYPTKYIDININRIINYNHFEGVRVGLAGKTSPLFSSIFNIDAYGAYGLKDEATKWHAGLNINLNSSTNSWVGISYTSDLEESSKPIFITDEQKLQLNGAFKFSNYFFHSTSSSRFYLQHNFSPKLKAKFLFNKTFSSPEYNYFFVPNNIEDDFFNLSIFSLGLEWEPFSRFMRTKYGVTRIYNGLPKFNIQYAQSVKGVLNGEYNFSKLDLRIEENIRFLHLGTSTFTFLAGVAFGDIPLPYLYGSNPNSYLSKQVVFKVNVAQKLAFETMSYKEFFSDKYVELHVRHAFKKTNLFPAGGTQINLISRVTYGSIANIDTHKNIDFKTLEQGYFESGIEFNEIFSILGLGSYYRYGANRNDKLSENLFFNVTFRIEL